jgi:hypothetical protein
MGKSRTVDELAKDRLVIPVNLRGATSTGVPPRLGVFYHALTILSGFPPADHAVRDYLASF